MTEPEVISAIAGEIMTPYVIMLKMDASFQEVINILYDNNISAVFIYDDSKDDYYIISQTDIVNFLNKGGMFKQNLAEISVLEVMQGPIEMLDIDTPIDNIIRFMTKHKYKRVLVSKKGKAAGVVSTRDILMWNNTYFRVAKPQILLIIDNESSILIAKHVFEQNIIDEVKHDLIDLLGGALSTISMLTNEVIKKSGKISFLIKERRAVLFKPYHNITGILICDYNSIELRSKLQEAIEKFYDLHINIIQKAQKNKSGINITLNIKPIILVFND